MSDAPIKEEEQYREQSEGITLCHVSDEECLEHGYKYCCWNEVDIVGDRCLRHVNGWDKALYYLHKQTDQEFENVWIAEDDVYFHTAGHIERLLDQSSSDADYIGKDFFSHQMNPGWVQWYVLNNVFENKADWYGSFTPVCRLSRRMLAAIADLAQKKGHLALIEALFISLAMKNCLKIENNLLQSQPIRCGPNYRGDEVKMLIQQGITLIHPVKLSAAEKIALMS